MQSYRSGREGILIMKRRTDFNLIKGIRKYYLNNMARLVYYTWQDEYKINHLKEFHQKISGALDNKKISLAYLTAYRFTIFPFNFSCFHIFIFHFTSSLLPTNYSLFTHHASRFTKYTSALKKDVSLKQKWIFRTGR